jgi:adenine-specific DNA-methyltransferase
MTLEKLHPSFTFTEDRLAQLRAAVPEAFADGRINWETLREALGEFLEEEGQEHFGLSWPGNREARRLAAMPPQGTLRQQPGLGVNEESTRNLFIEGDNLEVLKLLLKSYAGRVKLIYIDPPYNTGNDFIYPDNYSEPLEAYLRRTGQADEAGQLLSTNTRASGRFHSNWLSMMYPRLLLARSFLGDDGVIFVSINDSELNHLLAIMNEIFGEENFLGTLVWQSKKGGGSDKAGVVSDHEYVVAFAKAKGDNTLSRVLLEAEELDKTDDKGPYRLGRELNKWGAGSRREDRPTMFFPIPGPNGEEVYPIRNDGTEGRWRWGKKKMLDIATRGDVEYVARPDGTFIVYEKIRSKDPRAKPYRTWLTDVGTTADGSKAVKELFDGLKVADFPKPIELMKHLISLGTTSEDDIVMDFFAGYCTTAHATLEYNQENDTSHTFMCVQLPEPTPPKSEAYKAGFYSISALAQERIRRSITALSSQPRQLDFEVRDSPDDLGFRSYQLARSNFRPWKPYTGEDPAALQLRFDQAETPLVDGWQPHDLLTEVMLLQGFPLDSRVTQLPAFPLNHVVRVTSDSCAHSLTVCLDAHLHEATLAALDPRAEDILVCLDGALDDQAKLRLADRCHLRVI